MGHINRALSIALLCLSPLLLHAQSFPPENPLIGEWELVHDRSRFLETERPDSEIRRYSESEEGIHAEVITVDANGVESEVSYTGGQEGVASPLYGVGSVDTIEYRQVAPLRAEAVYTHAGMRVGNVTRKISRDGQEMTVDITLRGNLVSSKVYRKVETR